MATIDSSQMRPENFDDDEWIEKEFLPELHSCLCTALGAEDVVVFDWMLRKRAASFPRRNPGEENDEASQPSLSAHIGEITSRSDTLKISRSLMKDYTAAELDGRLDRYFGEDREKLMSRRYQVIKYTRLTHPSPPPPLLASLLIPSS